MDNNKHRLHVINYQFLADSIVFYESKGYKRVDAPWTVTKGISDITRPPGAGAFELKHEDNKVLVASGEQSFLYLFNKGFSTSRTLPNIDPLLSQKFLR